MPLYGTPQAGSNPVAGLNFTSLCPGDTLALLDGTEIIVSGSKSVAFSRAMMGSTDAGTTFQVTGCGAGTSITVQASNGVFTTPTLANMDASFADVPGGALLGNGFYTDQGRAAFYRILVVNFVSGDVPVVIAKR